MINHKKVRIDGILFDSKTEAEYYVFLKYQQSTGVITGLRWKFRTQKIRKEKEL